MFFCKIYAARATRCLVGATYVMRLQRAKPCGISMPSPAVARLQCLQLCLKMPPLWQKTTIGFAGIQEAFGSHSRRSSSRRSNSVAGDEDQATT